jgi:phospholipid transport system transporter-binding protein
VVAVALPTTLTLAEAAASLAWLQEAVGRAPAGQPFEIDASALEAFDTSAIAVLLEAQRAAIGRGLAFRLSAAPPKLGQLAELYGVHQLLGLRPAAG